MGQAKMRGTQQERKAAAITRDAKAAAERARLKRVAEQLLSPELREYRRKKRTQTQMKVAMLAGFAASLST